MTINLPLWKQFSQMSDLLRQLFFLPAVEQLSTTAICFPLNDISLKVYFELMGALPARLCVST
ncbi:hypothetical protein NBRC116589_17600 [Ruegeria sp. HU-ET01832]